MDFKTLVWNARGWRNKKENLHKKVQEYNVRMITETKNKKSDCFRVYRGYREDFEK